MEIEALEHYMAIAREPIPCDGCEYRRRCTEQRLSCLAFAAYQSRPNAPWHGAAREPSREIDAALFPGDGVGRRVRTVRGIVHRAGVVGIDIIPVIPGPHG